MDKANAFLVLVIAAILICFAVYAKNNPSNTTKSNKIDSVIVQSILHDSIYKNKVVIKRDSFIQYVKVRDSILTDSTKIDSVLNTKIDTTENIKITAIVLADSLSTCKENLAGANDELKYKDSVINKIGEINKEPVKEKFDYKTNAISAVVGFFLTLFLFWSIN